MLISWDLWSVIPSRWTLHLRVLLFVRRVRKVELCDSWGETSIRCSRLKNPGNPTYCLAWQQRGHSRSKDLFRGGVFFPAYLLISSIVSSSCSASSSSRGPWKFFRILFFWIRCIRITWRTFSFNSPIELQHKTSAHKLHQTKQHPSISTKTNVGINIPQLNCNNNNNNMERHSWCCIIFNHSSCSNSHHAQRESTHPTAIGVVGPPPTE